MSISLKSAKTLLLLISIGLLSKSALSANTDRVDYNKYEMDALVKDIMWCGQSNEAILILTEKGTVYRSRDKGASWKKL